MNLEELKNLLREGGVVGAGGAGFPTYAKLDKRADTIILNCAECEPLLKLHRQVLERYTDDILSALDLIAKTVGAKNVIIGIKKAYKRTFNAVESQLDSFDNMKIHALPEVYPAGDEVVLIYEATKRVVPPGKLPIDVGVTVFNVETVYNLSKLLNGHPVTHKFVSVVGEVANPVTLNVPIGTPVSKLIELAGGATTEDPVLIMGGPMTGNIGSEYQSVTKTTNAVIVLPASHTLVKKKQSKTTIDIKRAMAACCQCDYCTSLCPRNLLGHPIEPSKFMLYASNNFTKDVSPYVNSLFCCSCGLCELYSCGQGLHPRALLDACKSGLRANGVRPPQDAEQKPVSLSREKRMVPMNRLIARLGLVAYNKPAPLKSAPVAAVSVKIPLSQHIGAPAVPVVAVGDLVKEGQLIAAAADKALSVNIHSSIKGEITKISDKFITIEVRN